MDDGSGTAGANPETVVAPPSMTETLPGLNEVALVEMTNTNDEVPGKILAESAGPKENPTTDAAAVLRSAVIGETVPLTNKLPGREPPSKRKPTLVAKSPKNDSV